MHSVLQRIFCTNASNATVNGDVKITQALQSDAKLEAHLFIPWPEALANLNVAPKIVPMVQEDLLQQLDSMFPALLPHEYAHFESSVLLYDDFQLVREGKKLSMEDCILCMHNYDRDMLAQYVHACTMCYGLHRYRISKILTDRINSFFERCSKNSLMEMEVYEKEKESVFYDKQFTEDLKKVAQRGVAVLQNTEKAVPALMLGDQPYPAILQGICTALGQLGEFYCNAPKVYTVELQKPTWVDEQHWCNSVKYFFSRRSRFIMGDLSEDCMFTHEASGQYFVRRKQWQPTGRDLAGAREADFGVSPIQELDNKYLFKKLCIKLEIPVMPSVVMTRIDEGIRRYMTDVYYCEDSTALFPRQDWEIQSEYLPETCEEAFKAQPNKRFKPLDGVDGKGQQNVFCAFDAVITQPERTLDAKIQNEFKIKNLLVKTHLMQLWSRLTATTKQQCLQFLEAPAVHEPDFRLMLENKAETTLSIGLIEFKALMINKELCLVSALGEDQEHLGFAFPLQPNKQWVPVVPNDESRNPINREHSQVCSRVWESSELQAKITEHATRLADYMQNVFGVSVFRVDFFALFDANAELSLVANEAMQWFGSMINKLKCAKNASMNSQQESVRQYYQVITDGLNQVEIKLHNAVCANFASGKKRMKH